jgi:CRISPR-associated protein Cst2
MKCPLEVNKMNFVSGLVLIDTPHSALNMFGTDTSVAERNRMVVKKLKRGRESYVYVSAQSWRYWWRQTLENKFKWNLSPLYKVESKNQVYTKANPVKYEDDDVFGYMRAVENLTVTRISPLKNTPLISVFPLRNSVTSDFANTSRHEGSPVLYESEFYSTVLKGAFSLDLDSVGNFLFRDQAGFRNLINFDSLIDKIKDSKTKDKKKKIEKLENLKKEIAWEKEYLKAAEEMGAEINETAWIMPNDVRKERAQNTLNALKYLNGGAKQTLFLTDLTPKFIILAMFEGGLNPFISDIVYEKNGEIIFDDRTLIARIKDFEDALITKRIFIGKDEGFMKEWDPKITQLNQYNGEKSKGHKKGTGKNKIKVISGSVNKIIDKFNDEFKVVYGVNNDKSED